MFKKINDLILVTLLSVTVPAVLRAVAVPPELIQNEVADSRGTLYGLIFLVLVVGIALGIWVQKRLNHS